MAQDDSKKIADLDIKQKDLEAKQNDLDAKQKDLEAKQNDLNVKQSDLVIKHNDLEAKQKIIDQKLAEFQELKDKLFDEDRTDRQLQRLKSMEKIIARFQEAERLGIPIGPAGDRLNGPKRGRKEGN